MEATEAEVKKLLKAKIILSDERVYDMSFKIPLTTLAEEEEWLYKNASKPLLDDNCG